MTSLEVGGRPARRAPGRAALAWSAAALFFFYAFMQRVAPSVMVEELMRDFAVGAAAIGHLSAFYFYAYVALQIPIGLVMDRLGPRVLLAGAALLAALGSLVFAASGGFAGAASGRLLIGLGVAFSWVGALVIATQLFPPGRFALLAGIGQALGMAGAVFGQAPLGLAVAATGWRVTVALLGVLGLALAAALWLCVPARRARPAEEGSAAALLAGLGRVAANRQSWLAAAIALTLTAPMLGFAGLWAVPFFGVRYAMERPEAAALVSLIFVGWGVGAPFIGWLSDRTRSRRLPMAVGGAVSAAALAGIIYLPLPPFLAGALLCLAGAAGSSMILCFATAREHNDPGDSGVAYGFVNTATVSGGALFQPILGMLLDALWDGEIAGGSRVYSLEAFRAAFVLVPAVGVAGLAAALALKESWGFVGGRPAEAALRV